MNIRSHKARGITRDVVQHRKLPLNSESIKSDTTTHQFEMLKILMQLMLQAVDHELRFRNVFRAFYHYDEGLYIALPDL